MILEGQRGAHTEAGTSRHHELSNGPTCHLGSRLTAQCTKPFFDVCTVAMKLALEFSLSPFELAFLAARATLLVLLHYAFPYTGFLRRKLSGASCDKKARSRVHVLRAPPARRTPPQHTPQAVPVCATHARAYRTAQGAGVAG